MVRLVKKKRILIFSSTRADYYLFKPLLVELSSSAILEFGILVSGGHLASSQGYSIREIQKDGFPIWGKARIPLKNSNPIEISASFSQAVNAYGRYLSKRRPCAVAILGDRYESMAMAVASSFFRIPIIHFFGGDVTVGAYDDAFRHAITKMATIHFPSNNESARRIRKMGEDPKKIFSVGSLSIDSLMSVEFLKKAELEKALGVEIKKPMFVITLHPETLAKISVRRQIGELLAALKPFERDKTFIFTGSNADTGGETINREIQTYVRKNQGAHFFPNLGNLKYFSAVKYADLVIGNSSSGILEVPFLGTPTVNLGDRQLGRPYLPSIVNANFHKREIVQAIRSAMKLRRSKLKSKFYGDGRAAKKICRIMEKLDLEVVSGKSFNES